MAATTTEIDHFLHDSLVLWASAILNNTQTISSYNTFLDGAIFVDILYLIEPELQFSKFDFSSLKLQNTQTSRLKIFSFVIKSVLKVYEELGVQVICVPDATCLAYEPCTKFGLENVRLLLMLLLDSSVKCDRKEYFINKIFTLPKEVQNKIANTIVELTNIEHCMVMQREKFDELPAITAFFKERDNYIQTKEIVSLPDTETNNGICGDFLNTCNTLSDNDLRSKLNKLKKELDEKSDYINELNVKFDRINKQVQKLHLENEDLKTRVRKNSIYRDEADAMREKAGQVDDLDKQVKFLRKQIDKMSGVEMKNRELLGDNQLLIEAKMNLENEIASLEKKSANSLKYQMELMDAKLEVDKLTEINETTQQKLNETIEENIELKKRLNETNRYEIGARSDDDDDVAPPRPGEQNLSDQLLAKNQKEIARLEMDNRKLMYENKQINEDNQKLTKQLQNTSENLELLKAEKIELVKSKSELKKQLNEVQNERNQQNDEIGRLMKMKSAAGQKVENDRIGEENSEQQQQQQQQKIANLEIELKELKIQNSNLQKDLFDERFKIKRTSECLIKLTKSQYRLKTAAAAAVAVAGGVGDNDDDEAVVGGNDDPDDVFSEDRNVDEIIEKLSERKILYESHSGNLLDEIKALQHKLDSQRNAFDLVKNQLNVEKDELWEQLQKAEKKLQNSNFDVSLKKKYEDLQIEYDQLLKTKENLKVENRDWKLQIERLQNEHECLKNDNFSLKNEKSLNDIHRQSFTDIKSDNSRLKNDFQKLFESNVTLSNELCDTKMSLKDALGEHNKCKKQLMRLSKDYQTMLFYNYKLEEIRDNCMSLVNNIMFQYHGLLSCTMNDKDRYNNNILDFSNQLTKLKEQKQSLETKLMQYYHSLNNPAVVKKSSSAKFMDYCRKWNFRNLVQRTTELNVPDASNDSLPVQPQLQSLPLAPMSSSSSSSPPSHIERYASLPENCNQFNNRNRSTNNENSSCLGSVRSRRGVYISEKDGVAYSRSHSSSSSSLSSPQQHPSNGNYDTMPHPNGLSELNNSQNVAAITADSSPASIMYVKVANTYNNGNSSSMQMTNGANGNDSIRSQQSARRTIDEQSLRFVSNASHPQPDQQPHYFPHPDNNYGENWFEFGVI